MNNQLEEIKTIILKALVGDWRVNYGHRLQVQKILVALDKAGYKIVPKEASTKDQTNEF